MAEVVAIKSEISSVKKISTLGRPFDLGMLYDRRSDKLIHGKTLWSSVQLNEAVNTVAKVYTKSEVYAEDTLEVKTRALGVDADVKLSFVGGLVNVQGAAKYLDDRKTTSRQSRVVMKYETTTELKQLTMEHLGREKVQSPDALDQDVATDVVVGILYGAKTFMIFDKELASKDESLKEVHGNLEKLVKTLSNIAVDRNGNLDASKVQKKDTENICCTIYGDLQADESPNNYEDAAKFYKQLPTLIGTNGENAVAIEAYLLPLSEISGKSDGLMKQISDNLVNKTCAVQEELQSVDVEFNDLMRADVCSCFPTLKKHFSSFRNNINRYKTSFQEKLLVLIPNIRSGRAEEAELGNILQEKERSPFAASRLNAWIERKKKDMKRLQGMTKFVQGIPFATPEDVDNEAFDPSNEQVVCCTFRIAAEEDAQIGSMNKYLSMEAT